MENFDPRLIFIFIWLSAMAWDLWAVIVLLTRRIRLRIYWRARSPREQDRDYLVHITNRHEGIVSKSAVTFAWVMLVKVTCLSIVGVTAGLAALAPDVIPLGTRQWVSTICLMVSSLLVSAILYNELHEDGKLGDLYEESKTHEPVSTS